MSRRRRLTRHESAILGWIITLGIALAAVWMAVLVAAVWFQNLEARSGHPALVQVAAWILLAALAYAGYRARKAWRARRRSHLRYLNDMFGLTPPEFEHAIGDLLTDLGYRNVRHVGRPGDLAADLSAIDPSGRSVVVQCKRLGRGVRVGSPDMQKFIGMLAVHHRAERGIYVTTVEFTGPAIALANEHGIELMDGERLGALLAEIHAPKPRELPA